MHLTVGEYHESCPLPDTDLSLPPLVLEVVALGVRLIGLNPLFSGVTTGGPLGDAPVPLILATLLPKKLPIPLPIPPSVDRISAKGGLVGPVPTDGPAGVAVNDADVGVDVKGDDVI